MKQLAMQLQFIARNLNTLVHTHTIHTLTICVYKAASIWTARVSFEASLVRQKNAIFPSVNYPLYASALARHVCMAAEFAIAFIVKCINLNVATNCHYQCVARRSLRRFCIRTLLFMLCFYYFIFFLIACRIKVRNGCSTVWPFGDFQDARVI